MGVVEGWVMGKCNAKVREWDGREQRNWANRMGKLAPPK